MVSIRDVARIAGVSPASVSRILNHDHSFHINQNTRQRVLDTAAKMNYSKVKNKRGPKGKKGMSIGLILRHTAENEPSDPYFKNIHTGIIDEAVKWRLNTEVLFRMHDQYKDLDQISKYGAIILIGQMTDEAIGAIRARNKNVILVDATPTVGNCNYICNDFGVRTQSILNYLYQLGHRNIIYIGGNSSVVALNGKTIMLKNDARAKAYSDWMRIKGLNQYEHQYIANWSMEAGFKLCNQMLSEMEELPTAIVVGSDPMALGVYKALKDQQIKIPDEVSIVSFDDVEMNSYLTPSLSSVYMDSSEMGKTAVRLAKDLMIEESKMPIVITCRSELHLRDSVKEKE